MVHKHVFIWRQGDEQRRDHDDDPGIGEKAGTRAHADGNEDDDPGRSQSGAQPFYDFYERADCVRNAGEQEVSALEWTHSLATGRRWRGR